MHHARQSPRSVLIKSLQKSSFIGRISQYFPVREVCDWSVLTKLSLRMGLVPLLLAGSRTTSGFPTAIPALEPTLAARSTCATKDVTRWFSRWWSGSIVSTPTSKAAVVLFIQSTYYKNRLSCGVAPFSFKSTREDSIVVVSVMACHLPAWAPVGTTGAFLLAFSSIVAA